METFIWCDMTKISNKIKLILSCVLLIFIALYGLWGIIINNIFYNSDEDVSTCSHWIWFLALLNNILSSICIIGSFYLYNQMYLSHSCNQHVCSVHHQLHIPLIIINIFATCFLAICIELIFNPQQNIFIELCAFVLRCAPVCGISYFLRNTTEKENKISDNEEETHPLTLQV